MAQFPGLDPNKVLGKIEIKISGKTKRIKSIFDSLDNGKLLYSLRTSDGRFLPSMEGARRMLECGYKGNRVFISDEASQFVAQGKTAFCKHVVKVDDDIFPKSEVFILNQNGILLAIGTAVQPGYAMLQLKSGIAVKPRHYYKKIVQK